MAKKYDEDVKTYTKKELNQHKKEAFKYFKEHDGVVSVKVLSRIGKVPQGYIRQWMKEDGWADKLENKEPGDKVKLSQETEEVLSTLAEQYKLSQKEELFCYHYLKTFNSTTSAIRAGYDPGYAHNAAYNLLKKDNIKQFLTEVKAQRNKELFIDGIQVIREYMKIAFADMTDFVSFGPDGVILKSSRKVDGQVIVKVKEGRDGVTIELADKMKALEKLSQYLDVFSVDVTKRQILEQQLELLTNGEDGGQPIQIQIVRGGSHDKD